ncbi:hypothetical protein ABT314_35450, partial [Streptomyces spiralis]
CADAWPEVTGLVLPVLPAERVENADVLDFPAPDPSSLLELLSVATGTTSERPTPGTAPVPAAAASAPGPPVWEIADDHLGNTVSVRIALSDDGAAVPHAHGRAHRVRGRQEITATADRVRPDAATVTVSAFGEVHTDTGHHITVDADITAQASGVRATGRITLDGHLLFDRQWTAGPPHPPALSHHRSPR